MEVVYFLISAIIIFITIPLVMLLYRVNSAFEKYNGNFTDKSKSLKENLVNTKNFLQAFNKTVKVYERLALLSKGIKKISVIKNIFLLKNLFSKKVKISPLKILRKLLFFI